MTRKGSKKPEERAAIAVAVFARMSQGESLRRACEAEGVKVPTLLLWIDQDADLAEQYARAMLARADAKFEELDEVSQKATEAESAVEVQGLRLKADNIKWQLARMNARKFGDKLAVGGAEDLPPLQGVPDDVLDARIAALMAKANAGAS